jgi:putative N6-adenine-specific DNA methylase
MVASRLGSISMTLLDLFSPCPRGLEAELAAELGRLGAIDANAVAGGVAYRGTLETCYRANLESRLATRVLWRVVRAPYVTEQDVYDAARDVRWLEWFRVAHTIKVETAAVSCPLRSLDFVTLRIKDAVCDRFRHDTGRRPDVDTRSPDVRIHAFLDATHVTLYVDTSGEPLFKRGIRGRAAEAPIKENLAAGLIRLTGWDGTEPFLDPMCGSGTFLAEAAQIALGIAAGSRREFAFPRLETFDASLWRRVREAAEPPARPHRPTPVFGADRLGHQIARARERLAMAGLADHVQLKQCDLLDLPAPARWGVMLANPPYGVRLEEKESLAALYPAIGDALKKRFAGWRCHFFTGDLTLARRIGLKATRRTPLWNGAIECRLFEFRIVPGSNRGRRSNPAAGAAGEE